MYLGPWALAGNWGSSHTERSPRGRIASQGVDEGGPGSCIIFSWYDRETATVALLVCGITETPSPLPLLWWLGSLLSLQGLYPVKQCDHEPWAMGAWTCEMASSHWLAPCLQG